MRIERATTPEALVEASSLFDGPVDRAGAEAFLASAGHHVLLALDDSGTAIGFVSGVETTHPDKGTEMFLYELGVAEGSLRQGVGRRLVESLVELAAGRGCTGMWVAVDPDNEAALRTYARTGAVEAGVCAVREWSFGSRAAD